MAPTNVSFSYSNNNISYMQTNATIPSSNSTYSPANSNAIIEEPQKKYKAQHDKQQYLKWFTAISILKVILVFYACVLATRKSRKRSMMKAGAAALGELKERAELGLRGRDS